MGYVFKKGGSTIRYKGDKQFSANATGWFGPSDYSLVGAYGLVKSEFPTFDDWLDHLDDKVDFDVYDEFKSMTKDDLNATDRFWLVGGNSAYHYVTGKRGQHGFFDNQFEDIYYEYGQNFGDKVSREFHDRVDLEDVFDDYIEDTIEHLNDDLSNIDDFLSWDSIATVSDYLYEHESMHTLYEIQSEIEHREYMGSDMFEAIDNNPEMLNHAQLINQLKTLNNMEYTLNDDYIESKIKETKNKLEKIE